jgi:hypothetical protein
MFMAFGLPVGLLWLNIFLLIAHVTLNNMNTLIK